MKLRIEPYLKIIRSELNGPLRPAEDNAHARQSAMYVDRLLIQLLLRLDVGPALQREALKRIDGLLDELMAATRRIDGGLALGSELLEHVRLRPDFVAFNETLERTLQALHAGGGESGKQLIRRVSAILLEMHEALDRAMADMEKARSGAAAAAAPALSDAQRQSLQQWLRTRFADEATVEIIAVRQLVGGGSKKTLQITLDRVRALPKQLVVRADQPAGVVQSTVADEYRLLDVAFAGSVPVPQPFALETDASIIGTPFVLVSCIDGRNIGDHVECFEPSRSFALSLARALAALHAIPPERFGDRVPGATITTIENVRRTVATFEAMWRNTGERAIGLELAFTWLKEHMHLADGPRALIHCDVGCHNMLAHHNELSGLLDWETAMIGNPAHDLAYAYPLAVQMVAWEDFLAEYVRAGGRAPSQGELDFYRVWTMAWRLPFLVVARSYLNAELSSYIVHTYGAHYIWHHSGLNLHRLMQDILSRY
jgi:aminoglycoside phosphotransferase (APT) family kinase protein